MTYDELKKKIQSMRGFVVSDSKLEDYWKRGYNVALDGVLEKIEELENEEHPNGNFCCSRCGSELAVEKVEGCTLPIPSHPWSGRSEKEIIEKIESLKRNILSKGTTEFNEIWKEDISILNWVLSSEKKGLWKCTTCEKVMAPSEWDGHFRQTNHNDYVEVSSAPKEKCHWVNFFGAGPECEKDATSWPPLCEEHAVKYKEWVETGEIPKDFLKEVSREEKPDWIETMHLKVKPLEPNEAIDYRFEFNSANELFVAGNGVPKGTVARISTTPLFTLSEVADLMEKIGRYFYVNHLVFENGDLINGMGYSDDKNNNRMLLDLDWIEIFRKHSDLVEKIRKGESK